MAVGAYDVAATDRFSQFSNRFVTAFFEAELPPATCAIEPLHFYGGVGVDGVTQRLESGGRILGAIVADDALNVVVLTGAAWSEYESIRGLAIYSRGLGLLEDRAGYPASVAAQQGDIWRIDLTAGGALVARDRNGPFVWLPSVAKDLWTGRGGADGCLGFPTRSPFSDPNGPAEQEFANGVVGIDVNTGGIYFKPPGICGHGP